jgi:hypothetical protein
MSLELLMKKTRAFAAPLVKKKGCTVGVLFVSVLRLQSKLCYPRSPDRGVVVSCVSKTSISNIWRNA